MSDDMSDEFRAWLSQVMHYTWIAARNARRPHKTEDFVAVLEKAGPMPRLFTRAEVLAFGERVREACEDAATGYADETGSAVREVRAVDVARLLEEDK